MPESRNFAASIRQAITPWQTSVRPTWTVGQIRSALVSHRLGDMQDVAQLLDSMLEDDELPGTVQKRIEALLRSEFMLQTPLQDRDLLPQEEELQRQFPELAPDSELYDMILSYLFLGAGVGVLDWDTAQVPWKPKLRALPSQFLRYDEYRRVWEYEAREGTQIVTPGDGKWVLLTKGQRPYIHGLIRSLAILWIGKQMVLGDWQRYCQKHGLPIIKAHMPLFAHENEKDGFMDDLAGVQAEGVVGLPQDAEGNGFDIDLLEAKDNSWEGFERNLARSDRKIQITLLGSNIGSEQTADTGGSRSAAETSVKGVDRDKAAGDNKAVGQTLREQLVAPFARLNWGPDAMAPLPFWDTCPEDDSAERVAAQTKFVEMLGKLPAAGFTLKNIDALAQEHGLELEQSEKGPVVDRDPETPAEGPPGPGKRPSSKDSGGK